MERLCQGHLMVHFAASWQPMINEGKRMELGSQIKRHRTERGLSQDDLAAKIYVSRQTVSSWENDKTYPDVESLLLLSVLFDVTVDELIKGDVEAMKEAISNDYKKMMALATGGLIIALSGAAAFLGEYPSGIGASFRPASSACSSGASGWRCWSWSSASRNSTTWSLSRAGGLLERRARRPRQSAKPTRPPASRAARRGVHPGGSSCRRPRRLLRIYVSSSGSAQHELL